MRPAHFLAGKVQASLLCRCLAAHFFERGEQPVELTMAVSGEEAAKLFARLAEENVRIFYVKVPIEYGTTGEA